MQISLVQLRMVVMAQQLGLGIQKPKAAAGVMVDFCQIQVPVGGLSVVEKLMDRLQVRDYLMTD